MSGSLLFLITEYICSAAALSLDIYGQKNVGEAVISALACFCLYIVGYLLKQKRADKRIICALNILLCVAGVFFIGENFYIPLPIILADAVFTMLPPKFSFGAVGAAELLIIFAARPPFAVTVISLSITAVFLLAVIILLRLEAMQRQLYNKGEEIAELKERISAVTEYSRAIKTAAAAEERSRFAVRIHDKLGHNISGSIILLEAARLCIDSDPAQAKQCIATASDNLRQGVDEIREALRQERPTAAYRGKADINGILSEFGAKYDKHTEIVINGNADKIGFVHWGCISENLKECLTNTLKHSDADSFGVYITVMNKIIRCEFKDNGCLAAEFKKGMGLTSIEERTAAAGGRAAFLSSNDGFRVLMIFDITGEEL